MEGIDPKFWLDLGQFVLTIIVGVYVFFSNRRKATTESIDALTKLFANEQKENEKRLTKLEEARLNALRHDDLKEIYLRLGGIEKGVSKLEGKFESIDHLNQAIQEIGLGGKK